MAERPTSVLPGIAFVVFAILVLFWAAKLAYVSRAFLSGGSQAAWSWLIHITPRASIFTDPPAHEIWIQQAILGLVTLVSGYISRSLWFPLPIPEGMRRPDLTLPGTFDPYTGQEQVYAMATDASGTTFTFSIPCRVWDNDHRTRWSLMCSVPVRTFLGMALASVLTVGIASSQQTQTPQPAPQPAPTQPTSPGTQPGVGTTQPGTMPGRTTDPRSQQPFPSDQQQQRFPDMQRIFMFSGKVMLDDGTPPPESVVIERVCNGMPRPEAYTDSKGRFSFQLGQNQQMIVDASTGSDPMMGSGSRVPGMGGAGGMGGRQITERDLMGCELRASLAGFRSDVVSLAGRRSMDSPDIGTIVLHRLAKVDGFTFSGTSLYAPKDAKKAYEKGREAAKKKKWTEAERELQKATTGYSQYAAAWYELGFVYQQQSKMEEARNAYAQSIKADGKFITPYAQMARISAQDKKWTETADYAGKVIKLNPYFSPEIYFLSGVANLNSNKLDEAEEHAREAMKMDADHRNPRIVHLLGVILAQKQDYAGAAENMRNYLKFAPNASDADRVKQQLAEVEKMLGARTNNAQQAQ